MQPLLCILDLGRLQQILMDPVGNILQALKLASPHQRRQVLCACVDQMNNEEAESLAVLLSRRRSRLDILSNLSTELQLCIVDHLDVRDIYTYTLVCRAWRDVFLGSGPIVNHLLSKWFSLYEKGSAHEKSQSLYHAVRNRFFQARGCFRSRVTMPLGRLANGQFPVARREHLQDGRAYVDIACSAFSDRYERTQIEMGARGSTRHLRRYANGRFAWQSRASTSPIVVHDLHTNEKKLFTHPQQTLVAGLNMYLIALGNKLVIGTSERTL